MQEPIRGKLAYSSDIWSKFGQKHLHLVNKIVYKYNLVKGLERLRYTATAFVLFMF